MAVSKAIRDAIFTNYSDMTVRQMADLHKISTSTVQRIIKDAKAQQTSMAETAANNTAVANQSEQSQQQQTDGSNNATTESAPAPTQNSHFDYVPDLPVDQKEILELDDDGGMSTLLKGLKDEDPFAELVEQQAEDSSSNDAPPVATAAASAAPVDDVFAAPLQDDNELESMIQSLIATEPTTTLGTKKSNNNNKGRSKAPKRTAIVHQTPSQQRQQPPNNNNGIDPQIPVECLRTQIVLYVEHFGESLLQNLVGRTDTERKAFIKSLKNMDRSELTHWLSSCKGYITINNSVAMIKNSVYMGCSLIENCAPLIDMNCNGLTQAMKDQQNEISMCATEYAISNYSWLAAKQSPEIRLGTMVISCAMACDNKNRIISHHRAQQHVSEELQNKYQSM